MRRAEQAVEEALRRGGVRSCGYEKCARGQQANDQPDGTKADVMFVLDVTASMKFAIDGVESGLERILKKLKDQQIDAHVGLTVFRDRDKGNGGKHVANDKAAGIKDDPFTFKFKDGHFTDLPKAFRYEGSSATPRRRL